MIKKIYALSLFLTRSLLKEKANYLLLFFALLSVALSLSLSQTDIALKYKLFEDILLSTQSSLLLIASIFYTFTLLQKEKMQGIFIIPLSMGISRFLYQASIFKALGITLFLLFLLFFITDAVIIFVIEGSFRTPVLIQLFLYYIAATFLSYIIVLFSRFVSVMNASLYGVILFFIGNSLDELAIYAKNSDAVLFYVSKLLFVLLPNFSLFDYQSQVINHSDLEGGSILLSIFYFFTYSYFIFFVTYTRFKNKALKVGD